MSPPSLRQRRANNGQYSGQVLLDLSRGHADEPEPERLEHFLSQSIGLMLILMYRAIYFYREFCVGTEEIQDKYTYGYLPTELVTIQFPSAQGFP